MPWNVSCLLSWHSYKYLLHHFLLVYLLVGKVEEIIIKDAVKVEKAIIKDVVSGVVMSCLCLVIRSSMLNEIMFAVLSITGGLQG
jgi:hypothetical protein